MNKGGNERSKSQWPSSLWQPFPTRMQTTLWPCLQLFWNVSTWSLHTFSRKRAAKDFKEAAPGPHTTGQFGSDVSPKLSEFPFELQGMKIKLYWMSHWKELPLEKTLDNKRGQDLFFTSFLLGSSTELPRDVPSVLEEGRTSMAGWKGIGWPSWTSKMQVFLLGKWHSTWQATFPEVKVWTKHTFYHPKQHWRTEDSSPPPPRFYIKKKSIHSF